VAAIVANLVVIMGMLALIDQIFHWTGGMVGYPQLSFEVRINVPVSKHTCSASDGLCVLPARLCDGPVEREQQCRRATFNPVCVCHNLSRFFGDFENSKSNSGVQITGIHTVTQCAWPN
jgi:hypothetical protein